MTPSEWERIKQIFDAALSQPSGERAEFISRNCDGDHRLEAEVHGLLGADERVGRFLETPMFDIQADEPLSSGQTLSRRFKILCLIGEGGMGTVYKALDTDLGINVALKTIRSEISSNANSLARFKQEIQLARRITHPNICRTFDLGKHSPDSGSIGGTRQDITFLTMEFLDGETLADLLRRDNRLCEIQALEIIGQIVDGLDAAHNLGIIHRDIKPSNILLAPVGNKTRIVITDFGLARTIVSIPNMGEDLSSLTGTGFALGTLAYMAPEQLDRSTVSIATDIYALGILMYEMITGVRPFEDGSPISVLSRLKGVPSPRIFVPNLNPQWEAAIVGCLHLDPPSRFQNVREVLNVIVGSDSCRKSAQPAPVRTAVRIVDSRTMYSARRIIRKHILTAVVAISLTSLALFALFSRHYWEQRNAATTAGAAIIMTDIRNDTRNKLFDGVTDLIRNQLSQSSYFNIVDQPTIEGILGQMIRPNDSIRIPSTAREVAMRTGAPRVIFGAVSRVGDSYVLDIDIEQPDNNPNKARAHWEKHWSWRPAESLEASKSIPDGFLDVIRESSDWMRQEVGEAANDIGRLDAPPRDVTTDNWEALSEFAVAERLKAGNDRNGAIIALRNAIKADPHFALAYVRLGDVLTSMLRYEEGYRAYAEGLEQGEGRRLTRRERDRLKGIFAIDTEDFETAEAAFHDYATYYSGDDLGWFYRGYPLMMMGRVEEAITTLKKAAELAPSKPFAPLHISRFNLILGSFEEARKWTSYLRQRGHDDDANYSDGANEFLQGNYEKAMELFSALRDSKDLQYRSFSFVLQACVAAERGRYGDAVQYLNDGINADLANGDIPDRARKLLDRAYLEFKLHDYETSMNDCLSALKLDRSLRSSVDAGSILGRSASEVTGTLKVRLVAALLSVEAKLPKEHLRPVSDIVRARLRGEILLAQGKCDLALEEFRRADHLDAPANDREYLARGFMDASMKQADPVLSRSYKQAALAAYSHDIVRPGQIWQQPQNYYPGYLSDQEFNYARLASQLGQFDGATQNKLNQYLTRRATADSGLVDIEEAKELAKRKEKQNLK